MNNKNKNTLTTVAWIVIILCVIVLSSMLATGVLKVNIKLNTPTKSSKEQSTEETKQEENTNDKIENLDNEKYSPIIEEYKQAMNDKEYNNNSNSEEKYPNINNNMMHFYHTNDNKLSFNYTYYDINKDNKNELILSAKTNDNNYTIIEIYTNNGSKSIRFIEKDCLGERCSANIYDNGIIYFYGSSGAFVHGLDFYKIGNDGYSKETIESYEVNYDENHNVTIKSDNKITNYKTDDEVIKNATSNANEVDLSKLTWTEIKLD